MNNAVHCDATADGRSILSYGIGTTAVPVYCTFEIYLTAANLATWYTNFGGAPDNPLPVGLLQPAFTPNRLYLFDSGSGSFDSWSDDVNWFNGGGSASFLAGHVGDGWHIVQFVIVADGDPDTVTVDGDSVSVDSDFGFTNVQTLQLGIGIEGTPFGDLWLGRIQLGTTAGGHDLLDYLPCRDGDPFDFGFNWLDDQPVYADAPAPPPSASDCGGPAPATVPFLSPRWRFVVADLQTFETLSFLDQLASQKTVTLTLNQAAVATGVVPSDNPEVNIPWPDSDSDPFLAEGSRVLWAFREEGSLDSPPVWVIRFAGIVQTLEDVAQSDVAYSTLTAYDPWQYLLSRPVCNADGSLPGPNGLSFTATRIDVIAATLLKNTIDNQGACGIDAGTSYGGTSFYAGTINTLDPIDINFAQGTSVGQAWQQLTNGDLCDIVLAPIYDPVNRPGYLVEFNIYAEVGSARDEAIFAWDMPSRSLIGIDRTYSGTERANVVKYFAGQGGSATGGETIMQQEDHPSIDKFGEYWRQQFFPNQTVAAAVEALAQAQLQLSKNGRITVVFSPAPERSPQPFLDYSLGDRVPVYASNRFRAPIPDPSASTSDQQNYQRIYGIPITILDDTTEQIQQMLTSIPAA